MNELALTARLSRFAGLLEATECSCADGAAMPLESALEAIGDALAATRGRGSVFLAANGGSAAIVSHVQTDLVNTAGLRAFTLHEPSLMTCMSNDHGYDQAFARILQQMRPTATDVLIAVSSSGRSPNLLAAADAFLAGGGTLVTLTGFAPDNPLRRMGRLNLWLDACDYGLVECGHQFLLHNLTDRLAHANGGTA